MAVTKIFQWKNGMTKTILMSFYGFLGGRAGIIGGWVGCIEARDGDGVGSLVACLAGLVELLLLKM